MLSQLRNIVEHVSQAGNASDALSVLVTETRQAMNADCCSVYLTDTEHGRYRLCASDGLADSSIGKVSMGFDEGIVGLVGQREEPINLADAPSHPSFKYFPETAEETFKALLGTPITHRGDVLGVLVVQQILPRSFDQGEESFLVTLATHLAGVLAHSEVKDKLQSAQLQSWQEPIEAVSASSGVAIAKAWLNRPRHSLNSVKIAKSKDRDKELVKFEQALERTREELSGLSIRLNEQLPKDVAAIFELYKHMLADASLAGDIRSKLSQGYRCDSAIRLVVEHYVGQFEAMSDSYLRERALDVRDLGQRLLQALYQGKKGMSLPDKAIILVAEEVTASMFAELPRELIAGVVSQRGAANSHAAILARAMGIPALLGFSLDVLQLDNLQLIVDGYTGKLFVEPDALLQQEYAELLVQQNEIDSLMATELEQPSVSLNGIEIELLINAGLNSEGDKAAKLGSGGVGLYRTEVPFLLRDRFPSEQEQYRVYRDILQAYDGKNVCMRTLDVGGDKQLPYFPIVEENPALGWRGIRLTLDHPEIFLLQVRAMFRAAIEQGNMSLLLPMVSSLHEVDVSLRLIDQAWYELREELNRPDLPRPKIGAMLEVPSTLFLLPELAKRVDFWSVGSNDLTQYMLAVDRNNPRVAGLFDTLHPAVLRALAQVVEQGHQHNVPVCVCGELAGDPVGALVLLALGYRSLSMSSYCLAKVKYIIRRIDLDQLEQLRSTLLAGQTGQQNFDIIYGFLSERELAHLVRVANP
ncbi:phosphoenolpyruvate--protein phosphotransferase [Aliagarivorans marinus]|uniref:phosphoenolpyruvate--protein phosphotransferase n=1 Tax=Aliagarivorans marinus TaxID=561965 RepID=UPI0003F99917|nr:phosphoenolpyruvate--protein phosphotransferase [Aliagarivorans marinus]